MVDKAAIHLTPVHHTTIPGGGHDELLLDVLKKYAVFTGRARRKEYGMCFLFNVIISFVIGFVDGLSERWGPLDSVRLGTLLPVLALRYAGCTTPTAADGWLLITLSHRRFHRPAVFLVSDRQPGENRFGPIRCLNTNTTVKARKGGPSPKAARVFTPEFPSALKRRCTAVRDIGR